VASASVLLPLHGISHRCRSTGVAPEARDTAPGVQDTAFTYDWAAGRLMEILQATDMGTWSCTRHGNVRCFWLLPSAPAVLAFHRSLLHRGCMTWECWQWARSPQRMPIMHTGTQPAPARTPHKRCRGMGTLMQGVKVIFPRQQKWRSFDEHAPKLDEGSQMCLRALVAVQLSTSYAT
jgi:hypothetical protein